MSYPCSRCGECCRNLDKSNLYDELNRGDGTCKFLLDDLCSIYEDRPIICRIDDSYKFFKSLMTVDEYYQKNMEVCKKLQNKR